MYTHFSVPLLRGGKLCYSIQGIPGLPFNLLSNKHLIINSYKRSGAYKGRLRQTSQKRGGLSLPTFSLIFINVTVFWKTDHVVANTESHFLPVDESHTLRFKIIYWAVSTAGMPRG